MEDKPLYKNYISNLDIDRSIDSIEFLFFPASNYLLSEFQDDINTDNDLIEFSLISKGAYKEGVILSLKKSNNNLSTWESLLRGEQKTFSGSKLFYLNKDNSKILILSVPENIEGKIRMVINRINKINDKINRYNLKIRKENQDTYNLRLKDKDKRDKIINIINENLRV